MDREKIARQDMVKGPYKYEHDLHPCIHVHYGENLPIHVYFNEGDHERAFAVADTIADAVIAAMGVDANTWQPINTAPRDRRIDLCRADWITDTDGLEIGSPEWRDRITMDNPPLKWHLWWSCAGAWSEDWGNWNDGNEPCGLHKPTHWREIVVPPQPESAVEQKVNQNAP